MNCNEVQDLLNALVDDELLLDEAAAVEAHLQDCSHCQQEHRLLVDLRKTLAGVPRYAVPDALVEQVPKLIADLDDQPPRVRRRWPLLVGTHSAAALLGAAIVLNISPVQDNRLASSDDVVDVHVRSLLGQSLTQVAAGDPHTIKPWFSGKIHYAPPVYDLAADDFPLIGGRVDQLHGENIAVLVYRRRRHQINLFIALATGAHALQQIERTSWQRHGYQVVSAQQGDFIYRAVSDVAADDLAELLRLVLAKQQ